MYALNACGLRLRSDFGFPDDTCPAQSPLAEFNELDGLPGTEAAPAPVATGAEEAAAPEAATAGERTHPAGDSRG